MAGESQFYRYEVKGIQSFILATDRLREMQGASALVEQLDTLFDEAREQVGLKKDYLSPPAAGGALLQVAAGDEDGDSLIYAVRYSHDGGTTWQTLTPATAGNHLTVSLGALPGSDNALIEVEASDGFHTASDRSDAPFTVGKKPPLWASTVAPASGHRQAASERVTLVGSGYDLEDGVLSGDALTWTSDRDGSLGSGGMLTTSLTVGEHLILLDAADSDGLSASGTIWRLPGPHRSCLDCFLW